MDTVKHDQFGLYVQNHVAWFVGQGRYDRM